MSTGVVLVRSADPDLQLQGLRTALSLSLGDRQADLMVGGNGIGVLSAAPSSEAAHCLDAIPRVGRGIAIDEVTAQAPARHLAEILPHDQFVARLATADFLQVF